MGVENESEDFRNLFGGGGESGKGAAAPETPEAPAAEAEAAAGDASEAGQGDPEKPSETTVDATGLKSALEKERSSNKDLKKQVKELTGKIESLSAGFAAMGFKPSEGGPAPVDQAQSALNEAQAKLKHAELEKRIILNPGDADPSRLLRDSQFQGILADFDGSDEELVAEVNHFVAGSPWLKRDTATQPVASARGSVGAGQSEAPQAPEEDFRTLFRN